MSVRSKLFAIAVLLSLIGVSEQQKCQCQTPPAPVNNLNGYALVQSPTTDGGFLSDTNTCAMPECVVPVYYNGPASDSMGWTIASTECVIPQGGKVELFDGSSSVPFGTYDSSVCKDSSSAPSASTSFTANVTVKFTQTGGASKGMEVVLYMTPTNSPQTTVTTTVSTTTTYAPYNGNLTHDPSTVQMELAVAIDASSDNNDASDAYKSMKQFAIALLNGLQVHTDNKETGVRLSTIFLTPLTGSLSAPWSLSAEAFEQTVNGFPQFPAKNGPSAYSDGLKAFINAGFDVSANESTPGVVRPRKTSPRVLVLLAAHDAKDTNSVASNLIDNDVWTVLVKFGSGQFANAQTILNGAGNRPAMLYSYNSSISPQANAQAFFNSTLLNGNTLCPLPKETGSLSSTAKVTFTTQNFGTISPGHKNNGQKGRYCNFHDFQKTFNTTDGNVKSVEITVTYELEVDHDFLRIYDVSGAEQAVFTGYDVTGSTVCIDSTAFSIRFQTNNQNVYGGFSLTAAGKASIC